VRTEALLPEDCDGRAQKTSLFPGQVLDPWGGSVPTQASPPSSGWDYPGKLRKACCSRPGYLNLTFH
jgi:hypothetical protein